MTSSHFLAPIRPALPHSLVVRTVRVRLRCQRGRVPLRRQPILFIETVIRIDGPSILHVTVGVIAKIPTGEAVCRRVDRHVQHRRRARCDVLVREVPEAIIRETLAPSRAQ